MNRQDLTLNDIYACRFARYALNDARALIERGKLTEARECIRDARRVYGVAMRRLAARGDLSHHYTRTAGGWHAIVAASRGTPDSLRHTLPRTYAHRQSAQRAAGRYIAKLTMGALS